MSHPHFVITIGREFGSGGKAIGIMLSEKLGVNYYDQQLLKFASDKSGISEKLFGEADENVEGIKRVFFKGVYNGKTDSPDSSDYTSADNLFSMQAKTIEDLYNSESCIIIGRCANYILRDKHDVMRIYIHSSKEDRIARTMKNYAVDAKKAEKMIDRVDKDRSAYYRYYTGHERNDACQYDMCLDTSSLGLEKCVKFILGYMDATIFSNEKD